MSFEQNPAGLGVGKNFGARQAGNNTGVIGGVDGIITAEFQLKAGENLNQVLTQSVKVPAYSLVKEVIVKVEEAFAASSTVDATLDGTTVLTAAASLAALGVDTPALSGTPANLETGADGADLKVVVDANGLASGAGFASVAVRYTTI